MARQDGTKGAQRRAAGAAAGHFIVAKLALGALWLLARLPMRARLAVAGWLGARIIGPLSGARRRAMAQLAEMLPDLPSAEHRRIARGACANALRGVVETHAGGALVGHVAGTVIDGPGVAALRKAQAEGRGVLLLTGHFGSPHGAKAAICGTLANLCVLYRPTSNPWVNAAYHRALEEVSRPAFPRGRRGLGDMVRHLRGGGLVAILCDQVPETQGVWLRFFGRPALTALAPAELAVKYGLVVITGFGTIQPDGSIRVELEEEIPPGTPAEMMQHCNDRLEARVRRHPEQWLWMYPRWREMPGAPARPEPIPAPVAPGDGSA